MLGTLLLFCFTSLPANTPQTASANSVDDTKSAVSTSVTEDASNVKPDSPTPKMMNASYRGETGSEPAAATSAEPTPAPIANVPVQPASTQAYETPRKQMFWYGLMAAGHAGAAFDAWTTRRAINGGYGMEADPFQKPFAHSNAIYASTQVSPLIMDYLGHRMMRSRYSLFRHFWWVPQMASASISFSAAAHNYKVVP
jgi:hypothetical protein